MGINILKTRVQYTYVINLKLFQSILRQRYIIYLALKIPTDTHSYENLANCYAFSTSIFLTSPVSWGIKSGMYLLCKLEVTFHSSFSFNPLHQFFLSIVSHLMIKTKPDLFPDAHLLFLQILFSLVDPLASNVVII